MVCSNHMSIQDEVNQVVIHELIHAYDDCRAANLDWANCAHHACSEVCVSCDGNFLVLRFIFSFHKISFSFIHVKQIRAGHLSGDCHYKRELLRGFMKIRGHEQVWFFVFIFK
jgi:inner membrane protease ATP23